MRKLRKMLSMILAILMLVSYTPVLSVSEITETERSELDETEAIETEESELGETEATETEESELDETEATETEGPELDEGLNKEEIIYNLGNQEIMVGYDDEQAKDTPWNYKLFDGEGNYSIQLEENAYFPYEIQFETDSSTTVEWFEGPDSTIKIDGHTFSVYSEQNDDTKLSQIGVWIGGEYISAKPEPKRFSNGIIQPMSLLPLAQEEVNLDLRLYNHFQLKSVEVSAILSEIVPGQAIDSGDKVVWRYIKNGEREKIVEQSDTLDFSTINSTSFSMELIVGSALQLDDSNTRYIVNVTKNNEGILERGNIYKSIGSTRSQVILKDSHIGINRNNSSDEYMQNTLGKEDIIADALYVGLTLKPTYKELDSVKVYEGSFNSLGDIETALNNNRNLDVTDKLLNQDMTQGDVGFEIIMQEGQTYYQQIFTFVFEDGEDKFIYIIKFSIFGVYNDVYAHNRLYAADSTYSNIVDSTSETYSNGIGIYTYTLNSDYSSDDIHYLRLQYIHENKFLDNNQKYITKAVLGHFNTQAEAIGEKDIKDDLLPKDTSIAGTGYSANYSGKGQDFTIFAEEEVHKITIKVVDSQPITVVNPLPNPGSSDTNFRVNGANGLNNKYILPFKHDTYYDMGYQTIFYTDNEGLSSLKPTFWKGTSVNMYSGHSGNAGILQKSDETEVDFSKGPVQYAAAAENGIALKNYWVTFVKKHEGGSKLFVNGINGEEGAKREVFLTTVYDNIHDVFIANVGDEKLEGLTATLEGAQNIKLDPYWTVGGTDNDTLASFDSTTNTTNFAELANVAKIRLLPDGEGEITGTLKIEATGQEPVEINLTGNAGDPKLITADISEAVKYVPYAVQILHNNKYSWNTVTLKKTSGSIPKGVILKPNGELYGVPKETGTFKFTVEMTNSDSRFRSSRGTYTLVVKENTNTNVDDSTDSGYDVSKRVGTRINNEDVITVIDNQEFITEGEIGEFISFWLNGEKLVEDTDYTKEDGSTKITIRKQTFQNKSRNNGTNTIAAEFRVDGSENKELKRAAQNFKLNLKNDNSSNSGGNSSSNSGGNTGTKPKPVSPSKPSTPKTNVVSDGVISAYTTVTDQEIKKALESADSDVIKLTNKSTSEIKINKEGLEKIAKSNDVYLEIRDGDVIFTFSNQVINEINEQAKGDVIFHINLVDNKDLTKDQKIVADGNLVIDLSIDSNGVKITNLDGFVTVSMPYKPEASMNVKAIVSYYVDQDGKLQIIPSSVYDPIAGRIIFKINYLSRYMPGYNQVEFKDTIDHWSQPSIEYVAARGLIQGIGNGEFAPDRFITKAEFLQMMQNALEFTTDGTEIVDYDDVGKEKWYYPAVMGAQSIGLLEGLILDDKEFMPEEAITREEMAVILTNIIRYRNIDIQDQDIDITKFEDYSEITNEYLYKLEIVTKSGLMNGNGNNSFDPIGLTTRGHATQVQKNILDIFK